MGPRRDAEGLLPQKTQKRANARHRKTQKVLNDVGPQRAVHELTRILCRFVKFVLVIRGQSRASGRIWREGILKIEGGGGALS